MNGAPQASVGEGIYWKNGDQGTILFDDENTPKFTELTSTITNGIEDQVLISTRWRDGGMGGIIYRESLFFWPESSPLAVVDLIGYKLTKIRLLVEDFLVSELTLPSGSVALEHQAELTYEFFGTPVPDIGTIWLLVAGVGIVCRKREE